MLSTISHILAASLALALPQEKPDAPQIVVKPPRFDVEKWNAAYQRAEFPKILVMVGISSPKREGNAIGGTLLPDDPTSDSMILKSEIERLLLQNPEVTMVNQEALTAELARSSAVLKLSSEQDAINLLAKSLNAPVAILVRLQPTKDKGVVYRAVCTATDVPRAATFWSIGFDWKESVDAISIKKFARDLMMDFGDRFDAQYSKAGTRRFQVTLYGAEARDEKPLREAFKGIPGMTAVRLTEGGSSAGQDGGKQSRAVFDCTFKGEVFDLVDGVRAASEKLLGATVEKSDQTASAVTFTVKKRSASPGGGTVGVAPEAVPFWRLLLEKSKAGDDARDMLRKEFLAKNRPRITLLVNRELSPKEQAELEERERGSESRPGGFGAGNSGTIVMVVNDPKYNPDGGSAKGPRDASSGSGANNSGGNAEWGVLNLRAMEDQIHTRLDALAFNNMVDAMAARDLLRQQQEKAKIFRENELVRLLKEHKFADIIIFGFGRVDPGPDKTTSLIFTFRAVEVATGTIVGLAPDIRTTVPSDAADAEEANKARERLAAEAAAKLAASLFDHWKPPTAMTVTLKNAKSQADANAVAASLKKNLPNIIMITQRSFDGGREGGYAVFEMHYGCSFDELLNAFGKLPSTPELKFNLQESSVTANSMTLALQENK